MTTKVKTTATPAIDVFLARKAEIDEMLARLSELSEDHFGVAPDDVHWGHVGDLVRISKLLRAACDGAFQEGECAA